MSYLEGLKVPETSKERKELAYDKVYGYFKKFDRVPYVKSIQTIKIPESVLKEAGRNITPVRMTNSLEFNDWCLFYDAIFRSGRVPDKADFKVDLFKDDVTTEASDCFEYNKGAVLRALINTGMAVIAKSSPIKRTRTSDDAGENKPKRSKKKAEVETPQNFDEEGWSIILNNNSKKKKGKDEWSVDE